MGALEGMKASNLGPMYDDSSDSCSCVGMEAEGRGGGEGVRRAGGGETLLMMMI